MEGQLIWELVRFGTIAVLVIFRLFNSITKAGYLSLGSISLKSLIERNRELNPPFSNLLESTARFRAMVQITDKFLLLGVIFLLLPELSTMRWPWLVGLSLYVYCFDLLIPKFIAGYDPEAQIVRFYGTVRPFYFLFSPFTRLTGQAAEWRDKYDDEDDDEESPEDIRAFLKAGQEEGIIEEKNTTLLHNILSLNDTVVREIMTPRTEMKCIQSGSDFATIEANFKATKYSRLPIFREDIDHIEGFIAYKDLHDIEENPGNIAQYIRPVLYVPEGKDISDLLPEMLTSRMQMGIVLDEYGGTSGLITLEDVIEEIVGEIHDEHEATTTEEIIDMENGCFLVDGRVLLKDFAEHFHVQVESEDVDTIGGYIFNRDGRIPEEGYTTQIEHLAVEVAKADNRRIYQLLVRPENTDLPSEGMPA